MLRTMNYSSEITTIAEREFRFAVGKGTFFKTDHNDSQFFTFTVSVLLLYVSF